MLEKTLLDKALGLVRAGRIKITFWDGTTKTYGKGDLYSHLIINKPKAIRAIAKNPTLGFGESYMNGDLDYEGDLRMIGKLITDNQEIPQKLAKLKLFSRSKLNKNTKSKQKSQIAHHYDLGNDFYKLWLDESMSYSCAYYKHEYDTLEQAQIQKLDHVLAKLQLRPGMKLLDIGSGWGELLIRAAMQYETKGHGITLSEEQLKLSRKKVRELGLEKLITFELANYQDHAKKKIQYDRVVSVGMFEHVGQANHRSYFKAVHKLLIPGGVTVLHTISNQGSVDMDPWIDKYIFPGGYLPTVENIAQIYPEYNFQLLDYENLRIHYAMTLNEWSKRFEQNKDWVLEHYDEQFYRMWRLYLAGSESGFRWGDLGLSQFVFSKGINNELPLTREPLYQS